MDLAAAAAAVTAAVVAVAVVIAVAVAVAIAVAVAAAVGRRHAEPEAVDSHATRRARQSHGPMTCVAGMITPWMMSGRGGWKTCFGRAVTMEP